MATTLAFRRRVRAGSRSERQYWRFFFLSIVFGLLVIAAISTHPTVKSASGTVKRNLADFHPSLRRLITSEIPFKADRVRRGGRLLDANCEAEDFCEGVTCLENEEVGEGACCLPENADGETIGEDEIEEAAFCFTISNNTCPFDELCIAELIPGSGVGAQCLAPFELQGEGAVGIIFYVFMLLYLFIALAIVCDDYFTYALDMIADMLGLSSDVKGATFAAIGSSAPELFVSLADNVIANPPKSVGVGTIVGSAIFNILVIIGCSAIVAANKFGSLKLDWRPLVRDSFFYIISIIALIGVAVTGDEATNYEGAVLVLLYMSYLLFMVFNQRIFDAVDRKLGIKKAGEAEVTEAPTDAQVLESEEEKAEKNSEKRMSRQSSVRSAAKSRNNRANLQRAGTMNRRRSSVTQLTKLDHEPEEDPEAAGEPYLFSLYWPMYAPEDEQTGEPKPVSKAEALCGGGMSAWMVRFWWIFTLPINLLFRFTIPDARYDLFRENKRDESGNRIRAHRPIAYWMEFFMCIVHIAFLSHMLVFSAGKFGCLVNIDPAIMGLTILAAGTSVPDMITSVILTKKGEGDAAVANSIGSNVFDILIGLGLPWFIAEFVFGQPSSVATGDLGIAIGFLFGVLIVLLIGLAITKFHLNRLMGVGLLLLYVLYVIFELFIREAILGESEEG